MLNIFNIVNDFFGEAKHYESGGEIEVLINQGIIDLLFYETTPMHAKEYGLIAENPLYVQRLCVSENQRLKGIGKRVLEYIDNYAFENGNDVIFGHIEENASFTKDSRQSNLCDVDMIKKLLNSKGYETIIGNNDFYKVITKYAKGGTLSEDMVMVKSDLMMIREYAKKISDLVQTDKKFVAWVIAKIGKVEQTTASIKHALKAQNFEKGGSVEGSDGETIRMMCLHIGKYADFMLKMVESGIEFQSWMKHELAIAANMIDSVFHYLDYFYSGNHLKQGGSIAQRKKVGKVMHEYKTGKLKSHGKVVTDRNQAIAIALSEAGLSKKEQGGIIEQFQLPASDFVPITNGGIPSYNTPSDHWELYYEKGGKIKNK